MPQQACSCAAHLPRYPLVDARGIFCTYVCEACEDAKRAEYRSDIFTDADYWHDEPIEPDFGSHIDVYAEDEGEL